MNRQILILTSVTVTVLLAPYTSQARYVNTETGRFITMDTDEGDSEEPLSLHKYLYTEDNPVDNDDPSGNMSIESLILAPLVSTLYAGTTGATSGQVLNFIAGLGAYAPTCYVDVYVWDRNLRGYHSVGHVMCTQHGSKNVILSQFPFVQKDGKFIEGTYLPGWGFDRTQGFYATFASEKRQPNHEYTILVPDVLDFYSMASSQRAARLWSSSPGFSDQTQCSTAVWLSLEAGRVPFLAGQVYTANSGCLLPNTVDNWLEKDSTPTATAKTGVKQDF